MIDRRRLKELREEAGLSREQLADKIGSEYTTTHTINTWEEDGGSPLSSDMDDLCSALSVSPMALVLVDDGVTLPRDVIHDVCKALEEEDSHYALGLLQGSLMSLRRLDRATPPPPDVEPEEASA